MSELNTLFIGKVILRFQELLSTNDYAQEILAKSRPIEGTVIKTTSQTQGRGQIGSKWLSETGKNLTTSIILYPNFISAQQQFQLNIVVSLAVFSLVKAHVLLQKVHIKWPNDIYVNNKKIAGILIQNALSGSQIQHTIIGIGINVNQAQFSPDLPNPTSLKCVQPDINIELEDVLCRLCEKLEQYYLQLKAGNFEALQAIYTKNLLGIDKQRKFQQKEGAFFDGTIRGVSKDGQLMIETKKGLEKFNLKEIKFLF